MKRTLFLLFILLGMGTAQAQEGGTVPYDREKKAIIYTEVVEMPNMSKDKLYDKAMASLEEIYDQAGKKMYVTDKAKGEISMKCTTRVMLPDKKGNLYPEKEFILYKLTIMFKDGKYKYDFYDFHMDRGYHYPLENFYTKHQTVTPADRAEEKLAFVNKEITDIAAKLKKGIASKPVTEKEDW